jgi:hypothetical protein
MLMSSDELLASGVVHIAEPLTTPSSIHPPCRKNCAYANNFKTADGLIVLLRPLKVRMDIRDLWDSSKSSVTESVGSLNKILGHTITPRVEWPIMWTDLKEKFPDNTVFVPTVVRYTIAWYERLSGRLENEAYEEWTEQLLNVITEGSKALSLHIEVRESLDSVFAQRVE